MWGWGLRRRWENAVAALPLLRRVATMAYLAQDELGRGGHAHPFDRAYGVRTQQRVPLYLLHSGTAVDRHLIPYAGCVPSVLRQALDQIPLPERFSFVDLGCGKGRGLLIASEYPFDRILGVELNPDLVQLARRNARRVARAHPSRAPIDIRTGDASLPALPDGHCVIFLYHPFGEPLIRRLCRSLSAMAPRRELYVIYENPVHGAVFDEDGAFHRCFADMVRCAEDEMPFAFDSEEPVVIWRAGGNRTARPRGADRSIVVVKPEYRVVLAA